MIERNSLAATRRSAATKVCMLLLLKSLKFPRSYLYASAPFTVAGTASFGAISLLAYFV